MIFRTISLLLSESEIQTEICIMLLYQKKLLSIDSINKTRKKERKSNKIGKSVRKIAIARLRAHESRARRSRESMRTDTSHVTKPSSAIGQKKAARTNEKQARAGLNKSEAEQEKRGGYKGIKE
jgi:hypothetical protein